MIRETSLLAYTEIRSRGWLDGIQWAVYDQLYHHGPCTIGELEEVLPKGKSSASALRSVRALMRSGCVTEVGKRACKIRKHEGCAYDVTKALPDAAKLRTPPKATNARPDKKVLAKAVEELLIHCRDQRDKHAVVFSPEFIALCVWLKELTKPAVKVELDKPLPLVTIKT